MCDVLDPYVWGFYAGIALVVVGLYLLISTPPGGRK